MKNKFKTLLVTAGITTMVAVTSFTSYKAITLNNELQEYKASYDDKVIFEDGTWKLASEWNQTQTNVFEIKEESADGMLLAESADGIEYVLDNKYQIGDKVKVTYLNDDIIHEEKLN